MEKRSTSARAGGFFSRLLDQGMVNKYTEEIESQSYYQVKRTPPIVKKKKTTQTKASKKGNVSKSPAKKAAPEAIPRSTLHESEYETTEEKIGVKRRFEQNAQRKEATTKRRKTNIQEEGSRGGFLQVSDGEEEGERHEGDQMYHDLDARVMDEYESDSGGDDGVDASGSTKARRRDSYGDAGSDVHEEEGEDEDEDGNETDEEEREYQRNVHRAANDDDDGVPEHGHSYPVTVVPEEHQVSTDLFNPDVPFLLKSLRERGLCILRGGQRGKALATMLRKEAETIMTARRTKTRSGQADRVRITLEDRVPSEDSEDTFKMLVGLSGNIENPITGSSRSSLRGEALGTIDETLSPPSRPTIHFPSSPFPTSTSSSSRSPSSTTSSSISSYSPPSSSSDAATTDVIFRRIPSRRTLFALPVAFDRQNRLCQGSMFPAVHQVCESLLGHGYTPRSVKCVYTDTKTQKQTPHRDTLSTEINTFFFLTDVDVETGAPVFFPGSHDAKQVQYDPEQYILKAGDAVVFNSTLGHYGTATSVDRPMAFLNYRSKQRPRRLSVKGMLATIAINKATLPRELTPLASSTSLDISILSSLSPPCSSTSTYSTPHSAMPPSPPLHGTTHAPIRSMTLTPSPGLLYDISDPRFPLIFKNNEGDGYD